MAYIVMAYRVRLVYRYQHRRADRGKNLCLDARIDVCMDMCIDTCIGA